VYLLAAAAALVCASSAQAQQKITSPADLFPAKVLGYAEVRQPGKLANEIAGLFRDSVLGNVPESLDKVEAKMVKGGKFGDALARGIMLYSLKGVGLAVSPEVVKEISRLKGAAVAITGVSNPEEPDFLAVVLAGDSAAPPFLMRTLLTLAPTQAVDKVEGVTLYRMIGFARKKRAPGGPPEEVERRPQGPAFAMIPKPGVLFVGSPALVKAAILRAKGKGEGDSLAKSESFQAVSKEAGKEPGLFAYADVPGIMKMVEGLGKQGGIGANELGALTEILNPKAFRSVVLSVTLNKGTLRYREIVELDPKEKSPLLDAMMPSDPLKTDLLYFAPKDAMLVAAMSNAGGEKRWGKLIEFADKMVQAFGKGAPALPSEQLKQFEQALEVDLGKDVIGKITNFGVAMGDLFNAPIRKVVRKGPNFESMTIGPEVPVVFLVQVTDEETAGNMTKKLLPRLLGAMAGSKDAKPKVKDVDGQKVHSLKFGRHESVYYGHQGNVIVIGPYRDPVAKALAAGANKSGWLASEKHAGWVKEVKEPLALVVAKPVTAALGMVGVWGWSQTTTKTEKAVVEVKPAPGDKEEPAPLAKEAITEKVEIVPPGKDVEMIRKKFGKLLANEQPLIGSLTRQGNRVQEEYRISGLKPLVARLVDLGVEQFLEAQTMRVQAEHERREAERKRRERDFKKEDK
jgi:hypothetical protein